MAIKLIHGDCLEKLKELPSGSIDLIVTSPPYDNTKNYSGSLAWNFDIFKSIAVELERVLKMGGVIIWVVGDKTKNGSESLTSFKQAIYFNSELKMNVHDTMIYRKLVYTPLTHNRYEQEFEYMFCFSKGKPFIFNPIKIPCKYAGTSTFGKRSFYKTDADELTSKLKSVVGNTKIKGNIFEYRVGSTTESSKFDHPAMFPLQLARDQILSWSNEGSIVLDPFMGAGTTGAACIELKRHFIGIEVVGDYFNVSNERLTKLLIDC